MNHLHIQRTTLHCLQVKLNTEVQEEDIIRWACFILPSKKLISIMDYYKTSRDEIFTEYKKGEFSAFENTFSVVIKTQHSLWIERSHFNFLDFLSWCKVCASASVFLQHFQDVSQILLARNGLSCFWLLSKCRQSSHFLGERQTFSVSLNHYPTYFLQYFKAKAYPCHIKWLHDTVAIIQTIIRLDTHSCHLLLSIKSLYAN